MGELGKPSEAVADEAVDQLLAFESIENAAVDPHSADQILLPLVFASGRSEFTVSEVTEHLRTNAETIRAFLARAITIDEPEDADRPGAWSSNDREISQSLIEGQGDLAAELTGLAVVRSILETRPPALPAPRPSPRGEMQNTSIVCGNLGERSAILLLQCLKPFHDCSRVYGSKECKASWSRTDWRKAAAHPMRPGPAQPDRSKRV